MKIIEKNYQVQLKFQNPKIKNTLHTENLKKFIEINFKNHPGSTNNFWFPTTRDQGHKALDDFLKIKLIYLEIMKMQ